MSDDLSGFSLIELFRAEAESQTQTLSAGLLSLERGDASAATLESLMRAAHSIKGAARIVGLDAAVSVAHVVEDYFVAAQHHRIRIQSAHIDLLLRGVDLLNQIARLSENESAELAASQSKIADFVEELKAIINHPEAEPAAIVAEPPAKASPQIADIPELPESNRPPEKPAEPQEHVAPSLQPAPEASPKTPASDSVASPHPAPPAQMQAVVERSERVVRVTAENMTRLLGLAGESLVEARQFRPFVGALQAIKHEQATLWETLRSLEEHLGNGAADSRDLVLDLLARAQERSSECQNELNERIREIDDFAHRSEDLAGRLHHEIVASRMRPLADGTKGFPRLVRDLARQLGKSVHFEIKGDETGVDRDVLEKLEAPLNHLIRNALDHGIESAEERARAGKPGTGQICLQACHRAGMLQITLRDDGRGIDSERIRAKVVERGLVSRAMAQQLSELELFDFLFLPGFTTSPSVTEISGRGVGLDVVQNMVTGLGGSVRVASIPGRETTFTLRLPITMSVIRALLVQIGGEPYAFPLTRVERIVVVPAERIEWLEGRQYFTLDEHTIGLVESAQVLELGQGQGPERSSLPVVVLGDRGHFFGLVVDRFLGERDLDVRPLDPRLGKVPNLGGASVLEDGSPVLIFDAEDLVRSIDKLLTGRRLTWTAPGARKQDQFPCQVVAKRILVVDDSITVRELERQLLETGGYEVDIAVDGMDGWNAVRSGHYQLVVSDVDMPRMDGIEFVKRIKQDPKLKSLPVVIVSYKDREEDRMRGLDAGANCYLTKSSFHDQTFLNAVQDLIGEARE